MNEQFMKQAEDFMQAAKDVRLPENVQAMAEEGVARTREAYGKLSTAAKDTNGAMESIADVAAKGARELGEQAYANINANTEAAFDAAEAVTKARTLPEAAKVQADYLQQQMTVAGEQTKHFFELSTKVAQSTAEKMNSISAKAMDSVKS